MVNPQKDKPQAGADINHFTFQMHSHYAPAKLKLGPMQKRIGTLSFPPRLRLINNRQVGIILCLLYIYICILLFLALLFRRLGGFHGK